MDTFLPAVGGGVLSRETHTLNIHVNCPCLTQRLELSPDPLSATLKELTFTVPAHTRGAAVTVIPISPTGNRGSWQSQRHSIINTDASLGPPGAWGTKLSSCASPGGPSSKAAFLLLGPALALSPLPAHPRPHCPGVRQCDGFSYKLLHVRCLLRWKTCSVAGSLLVLNVFWTPKAPHSSPQSICVLLASSPGVLHQTGVSHL